MHVTGGSRCERSSGGRLGDAFQAVPGHMAQSGCVEGEGASSNDVYLIGYRPEIPNLTLTESEEVPNYLH